jgi:hypothetical protein
VGHMPVQSQSIYSVCFKINNIFNFNSREVLFIVTVQ